MTQNSDQNSLNQIDDRLMQELRERITEHLQVKDVNGEHVGTVDHLEGDRIKLTRTDSRDGQHHYIDLSDVRSADDVAVYLDKARDQLHLA
ncbi:DUF2171 domain-containing protein [Deinococcus maricopensis]|uniref:DUF2171 domain-containing protein n=1 Tax=Deinococcus maricopensis (strain DSM 21211 / LMG 22137 / NRRL B-23946 / LB-34) TaxID=709986 RepID=E8UBB3_DEIML|nr:DUF2171 domain-containing protein [Deinococcus maricopensis]ADV68352.1 Protein of unknown function DUF2171 [Deinococcus maricopensis DSM 21211]